MVVCWQRKTPLSFKAQQKLRTTPLETKMLNQSGFGSGTRQGQYCQPPDIKAARKIKHRTQTLGTVIQPSCELRCVLEVSLSHLLQRSGWISQLLPSGAAEIALLCAKARGLAGMAQGFRKLGLAGDKNIGWAGNHSTCGEGRGWTTCLWERFRSSLSPATATYAESTWVETEHMLTLKGTCPDLELHPKLSILHDKKATLNTRVDSRDFDGISFLAVRTCSWAMVWWSDLHYFSSFYWFVFSVSR